VAVFFQASLSIQGVTVEYERNRACERLIRTFGGKPIMLLIRAHPGRAAQYESVLIQRSGFANIRDVSHWKMSECMAAADVAIVHADSSVILEAVRADKPIVYCQDFQPRGWHPITKCPACVVVDTIEELATAVDGLVSRSGPSDVESAARRAYLAEWGGETNHEMRDEWRGLISRVMPRNVG
jgi:hypothetical protein